MQQPAAAAAAMSAPLMQQHQQQPLGLLGGSSGGVSMPLPAGQRPAATAAASPDFRNIFDDVFDAPPQRAVAAGGGGHQGGAVEDELLDFILTVREVSQKPSCVIAGCSHRRMISC
jgi:hypothetical protein